jgi:hypothetical protein
MEHFFPWGAPWQSGNQGALAGRTEPQRQRHHSAPHDEARIALIAQLIGDNRGAPNLWLARRILAVLDQSAVSDRLSDEWAGESRLTHADMPHPRAAN